MISNVISAVLGTAGAPAVGDYESIQTMTVGAGGQASITFSSIPSTYTHLQIRMLSRGTAAVSNAAYFARFNGDTGSNYYIYHLLYGNGTSAAAIAGGGGTNMLWGNYTGSSAAANTFGLSITDILDYRNTNKYKTCRGLYGFDLNGSGTIALASNLWMSTADITSITLTPSTDNFAQYTQAALYGVK